MPDRECVICGAMFPPRRSVDKTCSLDCQVQHRRKLSREASARHYKPRPLRPDTTCEGCGTSVPAPKSGRLRRWCESCRAKQEDQRAHKRIAVRRCYKCQVPMPDAPRQPGIVVCANCRVDPRQHRQAHERRRRLRRYGLTQEEYDSLLASQGGRCPGCGTDEPGIKGWCIDHCHRSGKVRALLCMRCNLIIGYADENPATLRALADWLERQTAQVG